MAWQEHKQKFSLNSEYRIEPILLSLTDDNYKTIINQIISDLKEYDYDLAHKLEKYTYVANQQLKGRALNPDLLKREFPTFLFSDQQPVKGSELLDYVQIFITQKKQRAISGQLSLAADDIRTQGLTPDLVEKIYKYISVVDTTTDYVPITKNFKDAYTQQAVMNGISLLCPDLDKTTGGLYPGTLCTVAGGPGSMKTTYTSNIVYNALKEGKNVLYLTLEEPPMQLYEKWLSRTSVDCGKHISHQDIKQKKLTEEDQNTLFTVVDKAFNELPGKAYLVGEQDLSNYDLTTLESKFKEVDKLAQNETGKGIDILVVDHIQLLKYAVTNVQENTVINMYVSFFRQQSLSWLHEKKEISVILLSQINRAGMDYAQRHNGMYLMQHIAEASEIERASSYIITTYTDAMSQVTKLLKVGAIKLRGAQLPLDTVQVFADGEYYQVGDATPPEQIDYSADDVFSGNTSNPSVDTPSNGGMSIDDMLKGYNF